jgi:hypothetical protein
MHNPLWARVLSVTLQNIPISSFLFLWFVSLNDSYLELVFSIQKMRKKVQEKLRKKCKRSIPYTYTNIQDSTFPSQYII